MLFSVIHPIQVRLLFMSVYLRQIQQTLVLVLKYQAVHMLVSLLRLLHLAMELRQPMPLLHLIRLQMHGVQ